MGYWHKTRHFVLVSLLAQSCFSDHLNYHIIIEMITETGHEIIEMITETGHEIII